MADTKTPAPFIRVWRFDDAPDDLRDLSPHAGDEDWLAHIPLELVDDYFPWLEPGSAFGRCDVSEHKLPDGSVIKIGTHA